MSAKCSQGTTPWAVETGLTLSFSLRYCFIEIFVPIFVYFQVWLEELRNRPKLPLNMSFVQSQRVANAHVLVTLVD